tara:strand:- start:38 stop:385 length:348 start_codon:yes stop_codon:yes gene_type:complete
LEYSYANADLLEFPQKYQMTTFEGREFLSSYFQSRIDVLDKIKQNPAVRIPTPDVRSKAYIQKILHHQIHFEHIIFMNDNRTEKKYSEDVIKLSKNRGFDISQSVMNTLLKNNHE